MQIVNENIANQILSRDFTGNNAPSLRAEIEGLDTIIDLTTIESLNPVVIRANDDNVIEYSQSKNGCIDNEGNLYVALKHIDTANVFIVYQSTDNGQTWNDLALPVPSGTYGTGSASYKAPSIYHYNNKIYVIFLEKTSSSEDDTNVYYNVYDVDSSSWTYPTNSQTLSDSFLKWQLSNFVGQPFSIVDSSGNWFVVVRASTTSSTVNARLHYNISTDNGATWAGWTAIGTRTYNFSSCLDSDGQVNITYQEYNFSTGNIYHAVYNGSSFDTSSIDSGFYYQGGATYLVKSPNGSKLWLYKYSTTKEKVYYKEGAGAWTEHLDAPLTVSTVYNFVVDDVDTVHFFYNTGNKLLYKYHDGSYSSAYTLPQSVPADSYSESMALLLTDTKIHLWYLSGGNPVTLMKLEYISKQIFSANNIPVINFTMARDFGAIAQQATLTLVNTNPEDIADTGYYNFQRDGANDIKAVNNFEGKIKNGIEIKIKIGYGDTLVYVFTGTINTVKIHLEDNSIMDITARGKSSKLIDSTIKHVDTGVTYRWMDYPIISASIETYYLDTSDTNPYLYEIWKDICMRAGFDSDDVDFTTYGGNLCTLRYDPDINTDTVEDVKGDWASFAQQIVDIMYYEVGNRSYGFFMYEDELGKIYLAVDNDFEYSGNDDLTLTGTDWIVFTDADNANYRVVPESIKADGGNYTIDVDFEVDYAKNAVRRIVSGSIGAGDTVNFIYTFCAWRFPTNQIFNLQQWVSHDEMYGTLVGKNDEEELEVTEELTTLGDGTTVSTNKELTFTNEAIRTTAGMENYLKSKKLVMKRSYYNLQADVICIPHLRPRDIICCLIYGTIKELYKIVGLTIAYNSDSGKLKLTLKCVLYELSGILNDNKDYLLDSDGKYLADDNYIYLIEGD